MVVTLLQVIEKLPQGPLLQPRFLLQPGQFIRQLPPVLLELAPQLLRILTQVKAHQFEAGSKLGPGVLQRLSLVFPNQAVLDFDAAQRVQGLFHLLHQLAAQGFEGFQVVDGSFRKEQVEFAELFLQPVELGGGIIRDFSERLRRPLERRPQRFPMVLEFRNRLATPQVQLAPRFPHAGLGCERCGICKGKLADRALRERIPVAMVGDGHSDRCAAERPIALASPRDSFLAGWAHRSGRDVTLFEAFDELLPWLSRVPVTA